MKYTRFFLFAFVTAALMTGCKSKTNGTAGAAAPMAAPVVSVVTAQAEDVEITNTFTSNIEPFAVNNIVSQAAGRIVSINVEVGSYVRKGQLLAKMDDVNLAKTRMQYVNDSTELARLTEWYNIGAVSQADYDMAKLSLNITKKTYNNLAENTYLRSPINGVVTARNYDNGDLYSGQAILAVQKIAPVKLIINVSEQYYSRVRKGDEVSIELDAYPGETFTDKVSLIYPTVDAMTHTFPVEINVANTNLKLRPGMFARATLNLGTLDHVVVPDLAIEKRAGSGDRFVYVYENGKVHYNKVELGQRLGDRYELVSGVPDGAQIVVAGLSKLSDGREVEVEK